MDRQLLTNSILNDYTDPHPMQQISNKRLSQQQQSTSEASAFDDLSTRELIELNNMLNAAIEDGLIDNYDMPSPPPELYRSPRTSSESTNKKNVHDLQQELDQTKSKLFQVETKLGQIKDISRRALDEYKNIKRRFDAEIVARQNAQSKVDKLQNELSFYHHLSLFGPAGFMQHSREELAQLHRTKAQVDQSVTELRKQRDLIFADIERDKTIQWDRFSTAQQQQLISLQQDTDHVRLGYDQLVKARDDIITEMILLNTKNAELSNLNNDLSRRMTEREREAMAVMAGTSFLADDNTPPENNNGRRSLENQLKHLVSPKLTAHRDSFNDATTPPRRFRFRRNRSKRSGSTSQHGADKKDGGDLLIGIPYSDSTSGSQKVLMFGNDLVKQVQSENQPIPLVVRKCIEAVERRGMDCEGVYRKSGGATQMRSIQEAFEKKEAMDLCDEDQWNDVNAITSVLKQYFRDLPNPLFTYEYHHKWVETFLTKDMRTKMDGFQKLLHMIPIEHFNTLKYLMQHLAKIDAKNSENLMTAKNLAVVFGPTLMRHVDEHLDLMEMNHKIGCIEFILTHMEIFDGPVPETMNRSAPLPMRKNSLPTRHRREASIGLPAPAVPPRENAGFI
ncbi:Rho GTPase activation protein [Chlamydoabsidia padenii]|nr:Rho GTPase activation protein [Chlamydoabsidia padenii]